MNGLVIFYNQCLEIGTEGVACNPVPLREAVDDIVEAVLEDIRVKMLLGAHPLYDFVVTVLQRFWTRMHPCKTIPPTHLSRLRLTETLMAVCPESEFHRLWTPPARLQYQPPFVDFESIKAMIDSGARPLDGLRDNAVNALERQFKIRCFDHRDTIAAEKAASYTEAEMEYREKLAQLKRRSPSLGEANPSFSNDNDREDM